MYIIYIISYNYHILYTYEPGSKLLVLGMVIQPLIGNPYNVYINPYNWVDGHPLLCGYNGSLDPSTYQIPVAQALTRLKNRDLLSATFWQRLF